jgi:hypothetical protein
METLTPPDVEELRCSRLDNTNLFALFFPG